MYSNYKSVLLAGTAVISAGVASVFVGGFITPVYAGSCTTGANATNCTINTTLPNNTGFTMTLDAGVTATVNAPVGGSTSFFTGSLTGTNNTSTPVTNSNILRITNVFGVTTGTIDNLNIETNGGAFNVGDNVLGSAANLGGNASLWDIYTPNTDLRLTFRNGTITANRDGSTDAEQSEVLVRGTNSFYTQTQAFQTTTFSNLNEIYAEAGGAINLQGGTMNARFMGLDASTATVSGGASLNLAEGLIVQNSSTFTVEDTNSEVDFNGSFGTPSTFGTTYSTTTYSGLSPFNALNNTGTTNVRNGGRITVNNSAGDMVNNGAAAQFIIGDGGTVDSGSNFRNLNATFNLNDGGTYNSSSANRNFDIEASFGGSSFVYLGQIGNGGTALLNLGAGNLSTSNSGAGSSTIAIFEGADVRAGDVTLQSGTTLNVVVSNGATGVITASGQLDIESATIAVVDGGNNNAITSNTAIKIAEGATTAQVVNEQDLGTINGFTIRYVDGTYGSIGGTASQRYLIALLNSISGAVGSNNEAVQSLLNTIISTSDAQLSQVVTNLQNASSTSEYNQILESLLPTVDGGDLVGALQFVGQTLDITSGRLDNAAGSVSDGFGYGNSKKTGRYVWGQAFGRAADQSKRGDVAGFNSNTYGFAFGMDSDELIDDAIIGLGLSYARTSVDSDNANNTQTDINSYQATLYGQKRIDETTYFRGMAAYVYGDNDRVRQNVGGISSLNASSNFTSNLFTLYGEVGREILPEQTDAVLTPNLNLKYTHYSAQDYTETGAGGANLTVNQDSVTKFEIGAGIDAKWSIVQDDGSILIPQIRAGLSYDLLDDALDTSSTFAGGGAAFSTNGLHQGRLTGNLGAGITLKTPKGWDISANYDFNAKEGFQSHSGFARASIKF
jgi:outer membrane autotransporter protein